MTSCHFFSSFSIIKSVSPLPPVLSLFLLCSPYPFPFLLVLASYSLLIPIFSFPYLLTLLPTLLALHCSSLDFLFSSQVPSLFFLHVPSSPPHLTHLSPRLLVCFYIILSLNTLLTGHKHSLQLNQPALG